MAIAVGGKECTRLRVILESVRLDNKFSVDREGGREIRR